MAAHVWYTLLSQPPSCFPLFPHTRIKHDNWYQLAVFQQREQERIYAEASQCWSLWAGWSCTSGALGTNHPVVYELRIPPPKVIKQISIFKKHKRHLSVKKECDTILKSSLFPRLSDSWGQIGPYLKPRKASICNLHLLYIPALGKRQWKLVYCCCQQPSFQQRWNINIQK